MVPAATSDRQIKLFIIVEKQFIAVFWSWGGVAERCSANPLIRRFHPKTNCDCLEAWHAAFDYIVTCPFAGKLQSVVVCCWKNNSVKRTSLRLIDKTANSVLHLMTNTLPGLTKNEIREEKILIEKVYYYAEVIVPWVPEVFFHQPTPKICTLTFQNQQPLRDRLNPRKELCVWSLNWLQTAFYLSERILISSISGYNNFVMIPRNNHFPIRGCCVDSGRSSNLRYSHQTEIKPNQIWIEHVGEVNCFVQY